MPSSPPILSIIIPTRNRDEVAGKSGKIADGKNNENAAVCVPEETSSGLMTG